MNPTHIGSTRDLLVEEDGVLGEVTHRANLRVVAWQLKQQMIAQKVFKSD